MKVHVTSVFLSVCAALVKSDLPVGWARTGSNRSVLTVAFPIALVPPVIWAQADPCDLFMDRQEPAPAEFYELDCAGSAARRALGT